MYLMEKQRVCSGCYNDDWCGRCQSVQTSLRDLVPACFVYDQNVTSNVEWCVASIRLMLSCSVALLLRIWMYWHRHAVRLLRPCWRCSLGCELSYEVEVARAIVEDPYIIEESLRKKAFHKEMGFLIWSSHYRYIFHKTFRYGQRWSWD